MKNKDINIINDWLDETYGHDLLKRPQYRIIWSVGEVEKRIGTFQIVSGPIFIREYFGVMEIPKYKYHPDWREKWVLERLDYSPNPELALDIAGHYEPLYVFYDREGNYQKPTLKVMKYYMYMLTKPKPKLNEKQINDRLAETEAAEFKEEEDFFYGCLEDEYGGDLASAIHYGEGIVVPGVIHTPKGPHWFDKGKKNASNSREHSAIPNPCGKAGASTGRVHHSTGE